MPEKTTRTHHLSPDEIQEGIQNNPTMVAFYKALSLTQVCNAFIDLLILFNSRELDLAGFHMEAKLLFYLSPEVYSLFVSSWAQLGATPLPKAPKQRTRATPRPNRVKRKSAAARTHGPQTLANTIAAEFHKRQGAALAKKNTVH